MCWQLTWTFAPIKGSAFAGASPTCKYDKGERFVG